MKWLDQFFEALSIQPTVATVMLSSLIVGLFGSAMAGAAQFKHAGWSGVGRALVIGSGVAVLVGFGVSDYIESQTLRFAVIGGCAAIGEDIWFGLKSIGSGLRNDPLGYVSRVIDAFRGARKSDGEKS